MVNTLHCIEHRHETIIIRKVIINIKLTQAKPTGEAVRDMDNTNWTPAPEKKEDTKFSVVKGRGREGRDEYDKNAK